MQYRIISPVRHDGTTYAPGEIVDFSQSTAEELLAVNAIASCDQPYSGSQLTVNLNLENQHG